MFVFCFVKEHISLVLRVETWKCMFNSLVIYTTHYPMGALVKLLTCFKLCHIFCTLYFHYQYARAFRGRLIVA